MRFLRNVLDGLTNVAERATGVILGWGRIHAAKRDAAGYWATARLCTDRPVLQHLMVQKALECEIRALASDPNIQALRQRTLEAHMTDTGHLDSRDSR